MSPGNPDGRPATEVRARLQRALRAALQARDTVTIAALRSAQAAIGNAEAVVAPSAPAPAGNEHVAGSAGGLGAAEAPRRVLTDAQVSDIIRAEISDRNEAAHRYERAGHSGRAARLRREADALTAALADR